MEVRRGGVFHQAVRKTREEMPGNLDLFLMMMMMMMMIMLLLLLMMMMIFENEDGLAVMMIILSNLYLLQGR